MSDIIHLLPDSVANQIAAGEVIQRPASVVKELMENALDAKATTIRVLITDAGRTCIQIIDDGIGMSETDARLSFERHATSKIKDASDLFSLTTMGFRGEALASIAAVSQVELKTRPADEELGTFLTISGSVFQSQEATTCAVGSNFCIKNLFYNVPARRKFLKSNQTELSNIIVEFQRIAIVYPGISFSLSHNDNELLNLPVSSLRQRIVNIFGKKINQQLLDVKVETSLIGISGFVGNPQSAHKKSVQQYFFVNGRYMRHPYFHRAVMEAYSRLIPDGESVPYFIFFSIDPNKIDVNIHPTKTEIKFEDEQAIWQILSASIRESLGKFNAVPSIDFDTEGKPNIPTLENNSIPATPKVTVNPDYNPFSTSTQNYSRQKIDWEKLYDGLMAPKEQATSRATEHQTFFEEENNKSEYDVNISSYQYKGRFIITSVKSGLMVIDQQRAHVRVLYDKYMKQLSDRKGVSQGMLFPEVFQLPLSEDVFLETMVSDFSCLGFELSSLGHGSYSIQGIPAGIEGLDPINLVKDMLHSAMEKGESDKNAIFHKLALSMANSVAIVPGQVLSNEEINNLIESLFSCEMPNYTPDGRVVLHIIKDAEFDTIFK